MAMLGKVQGIGSTLADARVTLKQIEDDIREFETKRAALGINGPWRRA